MSKKENVGEKPKVALPIVLITVGLVLIVGSIVWAVYEKNAETTSEIGSFQTCKDAGGRIVESYPEQCFINGRSFTNPNQQVDDSGYVGLTEDEAQEKASRDGETIRVVERDGESLPVTMDLMEGRLNLSVKDGRVYKVHTETISD